MFSDFKLLFLMAGVIFSLAFGACGKGKSMDESPSVASYKDKVLTTRMLEHYIPDDASSVDSARYAEQFIERWLKEQAIMDKALEVDEKLAERVEYKVQDYRAKLIMHEYHSRILNEQLNLKVSMDEIREFYNASIDDFVAREKLYSYFYIVTEKDFPEDIKELVSSENNSDLAKLIAWAKENATLSLLDSSYVDEGTIDLHSKGYIGVLKNIPVGKVVMWKGAIKDRTRRYVFRLLDKVEAGDPLPLTMCKEKIRDLIINERKVMLIRQTEEKIVNDAKANNYIRQF